MKKIIEFALFWALPFLGLALLFYLHRQQPRFDDAYFLFRLLFPALLMYAVVIVGAGYLKLWAFHTTYSIGGVLPQIGFLYSVIANVLGWVLHPVWQYHPFVFVVCMGILGGIAGTLFDWAIIHYGLLHHPFQRRNPDWSARKVVWMYGPRFFTFVGWIVGAGWLIGWQQQQNGGTEGLWWSLTWLMLIAFVPFGLYLRWASARNKAAEAP
jgi:hypothetical protein